MRALKRFFFAFFWMGLAACGGGGGGEPVVYRDDGGLVVDGREYSRRSEAAIKSDFPGAASYEVLDLQGKPGVAKSEIEKQLNEHGLINYGLHCESWTDENRCNARQIVVPPEWGDQWRRAMADWDWVEQGSVRFTEGIAFTQ